MYNFNVKDLYNHCVNYQTEDLDCSKYAEDYDIPFELTEEEQEGDDFMPMMNYCYPLPKDFEMPKNIKEILNEAGSITLIKKMRNDRYYLALSGGGMDLSWDICRAYMLLGYLPPSHFCSLPKFAGKDYKQPSNKKVIESCLETAESLKADGDYLKKKLKEF